MTSIKCRIKRQLNQGEIDAANIIAEIDGYDVVSFDLFDTLVKRNLDQPTDLFSLIEKRCNRPGFKSARIKAESLARRKAKSREITIDEIYQQSVLKDEDIALELEFEKKCICANLAIIPVYNYCIENNKKILIISDTYFQRDFIVNVLQGIKINKYDALYLSSEEKVTKRTGELYKHIFINEKIDRTKIVHIGDSQHSDVNIPMNIGIKSIHIPTWNMNALFVRNKTNPKMNYLTSFINNNVVRYKDDFSKFGYECFGPFLWGFTKWLLNSCKNNGISKIYFFSRDGYIMKKCAELLDYENEFDKRYLEVSRRSLRVPVLQFDNSLKALLDTISPSKMVSIKAIFDGVGLDIECYKNLLMEHGFDTSSVFDRRYILEDKEFRKLYEQLTTDIKNVSVEEYETLKEYLNVNEVKGEFAVVDIGWAGGMQRCLLQTLEKMGIKAKVIGFYTGVADYYKRNINKVEELNLNGYLFDFYNDENSVDKRQPFVGLFETLFLEQGGSVKRYEKINSRICAIRYPYEYVIEGEPTIEYLRVKAIQDAAIEFIRDAVEDKLLNEMDYTADELFEGLYEVGINPGSRELEMFADFRFLDEGCTERLAAPDKLLNYIVTPKKAKRDFLQSRWKIGFMKRLFKINLPYEKIYKLLLKYK